MNLILRANEYKCIYLSMIKMCQMAHRTMNNLRYYVAVGWWVVKLAILILILIPESLPFMMGVTGSIIYKILDPNFVIITVLSNIYRTTLGVLPIILQLLLVKIGLLLVVVLYMRILKSKYPGSTWLEIAKENLFTRIKSLSKPKRIS